MSFGPQLLLLLQLPTVLLSRPKHRNELPALWQTPLSFTSHFENRQEFHSKEKRSHFLVWTRRHNSRQTELQKVLVGVWKTTHFFPDKRSNKSAKRWAVGEAMCWDVWRLGCQIKASLMLGDMMIVSATQSTAAINPQLHNRSSEDKYLQL